MGMWKITLLGDATVGKTSLRRKFMGDSLKKDYLMTIGADFTVYRHEDTILHLWDLAGQQRFSNLTKGYLNGTNGGLIVFDVTKPETFQSIPGWIKKLQESVNEKIPMVLVGNKADLRGELPEPFHVNPQTATEYANSLSEWLYLEVPYIETSAITGVNVKEIFESLTNIIEKNHLQTSQLNKNS